MKFGLDDRGFYRANLAGMFILALLLVLFQQFPRMDFWISDLFFDQTRNSFVANHDWFWSGIMHDGVRKVMQIGYLIAALAWLGSFKIGRLRRYRSALAYFLVASLLATAVVTLLKNSSDRACPSGLIQYGGNIAYVPLFSGAVEALGEHCWPGGHILHATALLPIPFALRGMGMQLAAKRTFYALAIWVLLLNHTQLLRGQHFFSHHLWTLLICWLPALFFYWVFALLHWRRNNPSPGLITVSDTRG